ncbi:MAG: hypothetical protein ACFE0R_11845 [Salinarimonas sp.]
MHAMIAGPQETFKPTAKAEASAAGGMAGGRGRLAGLVRSAIAAVRRALRRARDRRLLAAMDARLARDVGLARHDDAPRGPGQPEFW